MLLRKSRPSKERLASSPLIKDVLIIFTAAEIKKIDIFPFTTQPQATEFATTKQRTVLRDTLFLGQWKPCIPNPKKVVPRQSWASPWQLLFLLFGEVWSTLCSVAQGFRTEEEMQNWRIQAHPVDLEMESCTMCNETQPITTELEKGEGPWEETGAEDSSRRQIIRAPPLLVWLHAYSWLSRWGPVWHGPVLSIFLWLFKNRSVGLCLIWGKHCVSASSAFAPLAMQRCMKCPLLAKWETSTNTLHNRLKVVDHKGPV